MKKPIIFLSYSKPNRDFVRNLSNRLKSDGINVWLDELEIKIGESIHQKVNEGIKKSDFFAVVLSEVSVKSKWVEEELSSASNIEKYSKKGIFILPILLEECDVPPLLLDRRYANFKDDGEAAYQELVDSIFHHFEKRHPEVAFPHIEKITIGEFLYNGIANDPSRLQKLPPRLFEKLVADILRKMGYSIELTPVARDGGIDIIATQQNSSGLKPLKIIVNCKRTSKPIGINEVRQIIGSMVMYDYDKAILVTSSKFTRGALETAIRSKVDLIDAETISKWIKVYTNSRRE